VERLDATEPGRVLLTGRWSGVNGVKFARPALILTLGGDGVRLRCEAESSGPQQSWAAREGEPWTASFAVAAGLEAASAIELSVAPDIAVPLELPDRPDPGAAEGRPATLGGPSETERLRSELAAVRQELELEREHRAKAEHALEEQRSESLSLRSTIATLSAELDLARTAHEQTLAAAADAKLAAATREHETTGPVAPVHIATEPAPVRIPPRPEPPRVQRKVNPSLRHRTWWVGRLLVVVVFGLVIAAIIVLFNYSHTHVHL
jgi:hypothetical protein